MSGKYALLIGNTEYTDTHFLKLTTPGKDTEALQRVLKDKKICAFQHVSTKINSDIHSINQEIEVFFTGNKSDDLLLLYFSGHGVKDDHGALYLAVKDTNYDRLRSTAIRCDFIRDVMADSNSKSKLLILDCCNSGAYARGTKSALGDKMGTATAFDGKGSGHIVLTATDAIQLAWEGDRVIGKTKNSLFTHFLIKGLEGEADQDGDGRITVDELYDYVYNQITPKQTPGKCYYGQQGNIILRQSTGKNLVYQPLPAVKILEFTKGMDALIARSPNLVQEKIPSLIGTISERLGKKIANIALQPALDGWRYGSIDTLEDMGIKIESLASHWLSSDEGKNTLAALVTSWSYNIRQDILDQMKDLYKNTNINIENLNVSKTVEIQLDQNIASGSFKMNFDETATKITGVIVAGIVAMLAIGSITTGGIATLIAGIATWLVVTIRGGEYVGTLAQGGLEGWAKSRKIPIFLRRALLPDSKIQQLVYDSENKFREEINKHLTQNMAAEIEKKVSEWISKFLVSEKEKTINMIKSRA
jgi:hypothetical protein